MTTGVEFGRVAVNETSARFSNGCFAGEAATNLRLWNVPDNRLTIETTEKSIWGRVARPVVDAIRELHDMGVLIALDDIGTGYASLSNLRQLAVDVLKIDQFFVQDSDDSVTAVIAWIELRPAGGGRGRGDHRAGRTSAPARLRRVTGLTLRLDQ